MRLRRAILCAPAHIAWAKEKGGRSRPGGGQPHAAPAPVVDIQDPRCTALSRQRATKSPAQTGLLLNGVAESGNSAAVWLSREGAFRRTR
jgi:hypothetical protein